MRHRISSSILIFLAVLQIAFGDTIKKESKNDTANKADMAVKSNVQKQQTNSTPVQLKAKPNETAKTTSQQKIDSTAETEVDFPIIFLGVTDNDQAFRMA